MSLGFCLLGFGRVLFLQKIGEEFERWVNPLCIFWSVWKARNDIVFRDEVLSIQRLKSSFVHLFWSETKVYFVHLVHFFLLGGLLGCFSEGRCLRFGWLFVRGVSLLFSFLGPLFHRLFLIYALFTYQKKKKNFLYYSLLPQEMIMQALSQSTHVN